MDLYEAERAARVDHRFSRDRRRRFALEGLAYGQHRAAPGLTLEDPVTLEDVDPGEAVYLTTNLVAAPTRGRFGRVSAVYGFADTIVPLLQQARAESPLTRRAFGLQHVRRYLPDERLLRRLARDVGRISRAPPTPEAAELRRLAEDVHGQTGGGTLVFEVEGVRDPMRLSLEAGTGEVQLVNRTHRAPVAWDRVRRVYLGPPSSKATVYAPPGPEFCTVVWTNPELGRRAAGAVVRGLRRKYLVGPGGAYVRSGGGGGPVPRRRSVVLNGRHYDARRVGSHVPHSGRRLTGYERVEVGRRAR